MPDKEEIYIVTMHRWGSRETHNYWLGAYDDKTKAVVAGEERVRFGTIVGPMIATDYIIEYTDDYNDEITRKVSARELSALEPGRN